MFSNPLTDLRSPTRIDVRPEVQHKLAEGLGFNWFAGFEDSTYPSADDEVRWQRIIAHAEWLNTGFVRFGVPLTGNVDKDGSFRPQPGSLNQLERVDAWARGRGINLVLDPFSVPKAFRFPDWDGAPPHWGDRPPSTGVKDIEGYVDRFVVPLVRHVVKDLGCTSVRWFNFVNEPFSGNNQATPEGIDCHVRYVEVLRGIRQGLDAAGLEQIGQLGPDCFSLDTWPIPQMIQKGVDPDPYLDGYCLHNYHSRLDWVPDSDNLLGGTIPLSEIIPKQLVPPLRHAQERGKPFFLNEVGTFYYGWKWGDPAGVARHDNVINELSFIIEALRVGCDGALRWAWLNPGTKDGWWQLIETVDGSDRPVRDPYYGYGTLYRAIDPRAEILSITQSPGPEQPAGIHSIAVRNPDGSHSLVVINDAYVNPATIEVTFQTSPNDTIHRIATDHVRKYSVSPEFAQASSDGKATWRDCLTASSITTYTTRLQSDQPPVP